METGNHADDSTLNIQNDFFNNARKNRSHITVFLTNGQRISGLIRSFDKFTLIMETRNGDQMVFKHAITTVAASRPGDEDYRGPRPQRPPMGARGGDQRPRGGPGGPPQRAPYAPPPGAAQGQPPRDGGPQREPGGHRPEGDARPRGGSGPQGKSFGNYLDLSALHKNAGEAAPAAEAAPPSPAPPAAPQASSASAGGSDGARPEAGSAGPDHPESGTA